MLRYIYPSATSILSNRK